MPARDVSGLYRVQSAACLAPAHCASTSQPRSPS
jgi:hypothetical protein